MYVDGFNLYYQLRKTGYKWLNLSLLVRSLLAGHQVVEVKYYTAEVLKRDGRRRQKTYWEALETTPVVTVHHGRFKIEEDWMRPFGNDGPKLHVEKTIEKQTDVSIGADMVHDAHLNEADCFVLLSNDSDQFRPLQILKKELRKNVKILNPNPGYAAWELKQVADQVIDINHKVLQRAQFPRTILGPKGSIEIPQDWYRPNTPTP